MIIYDGIKQLNGLNWMIFSNENGKKIEIPMDEKVVRHFELYFARLSPPPKEKVEKPAT